MAAPVSVADNGPTVSGVWWLGVTAKDSGLVRQLVVGPRAVAVATALLADNWVGEGCGHGS